MIITIISTYAWYSISAIKNRGRIHRTIAIRPDMLILHIAIPSSPLPVWNFYWETFSITKTTRTDPHSLYASFASKLAWSNHFSRSTHHAVYRRLYRGWDRETWTTIGSDLPISRRESTPPNILVQEQRKDLITLQERRPLLWERVVHYCESAG